jgi:site-specific DNA-cytosine methylase
MTIKANRLDWRPSEISIDDAAIAIDMQKSVGNKGTVELLAGPLPGEAFTEKRKGELDDAQRFTRAFTILEQLKPRAFFFESSADFLDLRHTGFRNSLIKWAGELGYDFTDVFTLDASDYGIVQDRKRSVFLGVKKKGGGYVQSMALAEPLRRTVGQTISDAAFPFLRTIEAISERERTVGQSKYLKWAKGWLDTHGSEVAVPDTLTLLKPRRSEDYDDLWRKKFGFLTGSDEVVEPHDNFTHVSVPLSIPVLKRLQGIPDDWVFVGNYDEQVEQVCRTIPPVISRILAHNIHGAISGEIIDLNLAAGLDITSNRWLGGFKFPSFETSSDPRAFRSQGWRKYLEDDDLLGGYEFFG